VGIEGQLAKQVGTELCSGAGFPNHERAGGTHIHHIVPAQRFREHTGAERPVSANIDSSEEHNERQTYRSLPI
jgi:hypothetical protein